VSGIWISCLFSQKTNTHNQWGIIFFEHTTNVYLTRKTKRKGKKRLSNQFAYWLDWTSYEFSSLFPCFFLIIILKIKCENENSPQRTNFDRLLIEFNFLIVGMRACASIQLEKTFSVADQLLGLDRKMMIRRTHRSSTILFGVD
jgi:hypothetical protein